MKFLIMFLMLTSVSFANELSCGETKTISSLEKEEMDVNTEVPKHLLGAKIILKKADGTEEVLKAEDFMVVKRKHKRPVYKEKIATSSLKCKTDSVKNIVSLKGVRSYANPESKLEANKGTLSIERETTLGAQYQRNIGKNVFLGVEGDLNRGAGVMIGLGF